MKKTEYQDGLFNFLDSKPEISYPLCIKMEESGFQSKVTYMRYCGDGRFECLCKTNRTVALTFGMSKQNYADKENEWLKILFYRARDGHGGQTLITNEEFDKAVDSMINNNYQNYLAGKDYIDETLAVPNKEAKEEIIINKTEDECPF